MANIARDEQVIREAIVKNSPNVRDYQVFREAIIQVAPAAARLEAFDPVVSYRFAKPRYNPMIFACSDGTVIWPIPPGVKKFFPVTFVIT
jgi:hypothetical protein